MSYEPTQEEIAQETKKIRATWSLAERLARRGRPLNFVQPNVIPEYSIRVLFQPVDEDYVL